jgi:long-subunit acyl-CoA synthetase (AMP-forming)
MTKQTKLNCLQCQSVACHHGRTYPSLPLVYVLESIVELCTHLLWTYEDPYQSFCKGNINTFHPSIIVSVPVVWEIICIYIVS